MWISKTVKWLFDELNRVIDTLDSSAVNAAAAIGPWLAPLAPATIAYLHLINYLNFSFWIALFVAIAIETVGLSTISTSMTFWRHNRKYESKANQLPLYVPLAAFGFYLCVVMFLNVLLVAPIETYWPDAKPFIFTGVVALLSTLSVPAAMTLAMRQLYKQVTESIEKARKERRSSGQVSGNLPQVSASGMESFTVSRPDWRKLPQNDRVRVGQMETSEIVSEFGVDARTARNWKKYAGG